MNPQELRVERDQTLVCEGRIEREKAEKYRRKGKHVDCFVSVIPYTVAISEAMELDVESALFDFKKMGKRRRIEGIDEINLPDGSSHVGKPGRDASFSLFGNARPMSCSATDSKGGKVLDCKAF